MLALENNFIGSSNLKTDIITIKADLRSILENERQLKWADGKMQELNKRLDNVLTVLSKPPQSEAHHHHHFPAILWATAGLFLVLCLVSSGWLMTSQRMEQFKTNCRF
ncbi:hypothetical protein ACQ86N_17635 [Puia sp. P3]|uniref:hypothetical protein n=1 Tax=Puia sp. P3 TaxID=3423952 RepID=UPI003D66F429